jgi:hypothetical protein
MINAKEIGAILLITLLLGITLGFRKGLEGVILSICLIFLVIFINTIGKKVSSFYLDSETEIDLWRKERAGGLYFFNFTPIGTPHPSHKFKQPLIMGIIAPLITFILSLGYFVWMSCLTFEVKPKAYRSAKRYGLYTFSEMTEYHIGLIAAWGIFANLILAIISYLIGFEEFAKLNIYFAAFNIIPLSNLDGNKILFGSLILWSFILAIILIALTYAIAVI